MLLLLLDSLLLLFITFSVGGILKRCINYLFQLRLNTSFIEDFLLGLIGSGFFFNLVSFFLPVNYLALIPLLIISIWFWRKEDIFAGLKEALQLRNSPHRWLLFIVGITCLVYWLIPPLNHDSADYHYHAVYWYENYKVIPGLGNVHGRLAFNPIVFIISAPYSFSHVVGQSIYPLNGVLIAFFYLWLLQNVISKSNNRSSIVYLVCGILLYRPLLANIPSPSTEPLVIICVSVVFLRLVDLIQNKHHKNPTYLVSLFIISVFAISAKLSSIPILLFPVVWVLAVLPKQKFSFYCNLFVFVLVMMIPWLVRNVILSGYLLYPLYQLDLFNVDWKLPKEVAVMDYGFGTAAPRGDFPDILLMKGFSWFIPWLKGQFIPKKIMDFTILLLCFLSTATWVFMAKKKKNSLLILAWAIAFVCVLTWLFKAPEYRFGMSFIVAAFGIPLIAWGSDQVITKRTFTILSYTLLIVAFCYHSVRAFTNHSRLHSHGIEMLWWKPLKDGRNFFPLDWKTFRREDLGNGVTLYHRDNTHDCVSIRDQPCMLWDYGKIEMRGNKIADGFRNVKNETKEHYPWMFVREW